MRTISGVDTDIFHTWAIKFVSETLFLHREGKKLWLIMDGYQCHISFKSLLLLKDNGIVVADLAAHASHVLQSLHVAVFRPLKEDIR